MENRSRADLSPPIEEVSELVGVPTIGPIRADILESVGIRTVGQLASCKPDILLTGSPATLVRDPSFPYQIPLALSYAKAISQRKPILTPHRTQLANLDESRILFVDLEYIPEDASVFIIGAMTMKGKVQQHFAESATDVSRFLPAFVDRIRDDDLVCVGYGSTSADVPMLRRAARKVGMEPSRVDDLPFLDLFSDVIFTQSVRRQWLYLPLRSMSAKSVARYFGYNPPENIVIHDGFEAQLWYKEYLRNRTRAVRDQLLRYNASDLKLTRRIFEELRNIELGRANAKSYRLP